MAMKIVDELCTSCGDCEPECPTESIKPKRGVYVVNVASCTECEGDYDSPKCLEVYPIDHCIEPLAA